MPTLKMHPKDACKILGIHGDITPDIVATAYRRAASKYHPDRNPAGEQMMKAVNLAYDVLRNTNEKIDINENVQNYGDDLNAAINAIINFDLTIEVCGTWLWVSGNTKPYKDILKESGFKWAPKKVMWYFRPDDYRSYSRGKLSIDDIRNKYGSKNIRPSTSNRLTAH